VGIARAAFLFHNSTFADVGKLRVQPELASPHDLAKQQFMRANVANNWPATRAYLAECWQMLTLRARIDGDFEHETTAAQRAVVIIIPGPAAAAEPQEPAGRVIDITPGE